jgi:hypothetical protein
VTRCREAGDTERRQGSGDGQVLAIIAGEGKSASDKFVVHNLFAP